MLIQGPIIPSAEGDSARFGSGWKKGYRNIGMTSAGLIFKGNTIGYPGTRNLEIMKVL